MPSYVLLKFLLKLRVGGQFDIYVIYSRERVNVLFQHRGVSLTLKTQFCETAETLTYRETSTLD